MRKGNTANARECALSVLVACRRNGAWADAALKAQLGKCALSAQDAALCSRIVYGVMQNELLLNWYLSAYCTQKLDHLQPPLADILRIGAYQILFLDKVPDHAAVSESCGTIRKKTFQIDIRVKYIIVITDDIIHPCRRIQTHFKRTDIVFLRLF